MSKSSKVSLSLALVIGLLFTTFTYAATPEATSSGSSSAPTYLLKVTGVVSQLENSVGFTLTTDDSTVYTLAGNTSGLEKYLGEEIIIQGYFGYRDPRIMQPAADRNILYVLSYSLMQLPSSTPIPTPTPKPVPTVKPTLSPMPTIPANIKLTGKLALTDNAAYKYTLNTGTNIKFLLTGKTDGMENYIDQKIVVVGYLQPMATTTAALANSSIRSIVINRFIFVVVEYYPMPLPSPRPSPTVKPIPSPNPTPTIKPTPSPRPTLPAYVKVAGTLSLSDNTAYKYALTTDANIKLLLTGKTDGMGNYIGQRIIVVGYIQPTAIVSATSTIAINRLVFVVNDYYAAPLPSPRPSPTVKPTPSPSPTLPANIKLTGKLSVTDNTAYKYALTTDLNVKYPLIGKTDGMENYIGQKMVVIGYLKPIATSTTSSPKTSLIQTIVINRFVFVVEEYYSLDVTVK